jgi:sugar phosphate isomerase/epimerase
VRLDAHWTQNLAAAHGNAALAQRLGIGLVTFHAGFLPHAADNALRATMLARIAVIARAFAERGVQIALETGQEDADTLVGVLHELAALGGNVGVNFDPANMLLYAMGQPVEAFPKLATFTRQVHIKDAIETETPGQWGREVVVGSGQVPWDQFLTLVRAHAPNAPLVIEREAGSQRVADIITARRVVSAVLARLDARAAKERTHG